MALDATLSRSGPQHSSPGGLRKSLAPRNHQARRRSRSAVCIRAGLRVVITGSTKGLGKALAEEFVLQGDSVIVTSRSESRVKESAADLDRLKAGESTVKGIPCNVSKPGDVKALAKFAADQLGGVDIWINNAGTNSYKYGPLPELDEADIISIVETNVLGVMLCCREVINLMRGQSGVGHIFNMDGAGADGNATPRFAAYGATKRGLAQLSKSLQAELDASGSKNVCVHNLSPGMMTTELLMSGSDTKSARFFINCLAEDPKTVAQFLVPQVRKVALNASGSPKPTYIRYLTKGKAYSQILQRLLFGQRKDRFVKE